MLSRRLVAVFVVGLVTAACGGSAAQREALEVESNAAQEFAPEAGGFSTGTDTAAVDTAIDPAVEAVPGGDTATATPGAAAPSSGGSSSSPAARPRSASAPKAATPRAASGTRSPSQGAGDGASTAPAPGRPAPGAPAAPKPSPGGATGGATDVGVTASSIKVGHIGIYSGPVGSFGDDLSYAARAGLQAINDAGGVNGRKLEVLVRDDAWDGTKGMNAARDLVERQKIFAMCCIQSVNTSDPFTPYADEKKIPHVGADGWGEPQYKGEWTFPVGNSAVSEARILANYQGTKQGAKRIGILYINNPTGRAFRDTYDETIKKLGGEVVISQAATFDDPGTTTFIAQARTQNLDTISVYLDPGIFARMIREAAAQNYKPKNGFSGGAILYFEATPNLAGTHSEGTISATHFQTNDMDTPGLRAYKEGVERYYPDIDHSNWTKSGYLGAQIFGNALRKLGLDVTRQRLKDELDTLTNFDSGIGPTLTFRPGQRHANRVIFLAQVQRSGDKFEWKYLAGPLEDR